MKSQSSTIYKDGAFIDFKVGERVCLDGVPGTIKSINHKYRPDGLVVFDRPVWGSINHLVRLDRLEKCHDDNIAMQILW